MDQEHINPMLVASVVHAAQRCVARSGGSVPPPSSNHLRDLATFWQSAAAVVGEDLAIMVALEMPLGSFGRAGYHAMSARVLGEALHIVASQYLSNLIPALSLQILPRTNDSIDVVVRGEGEAEWMFALEEFAIAALHQQLITSAASVRSMYVTLRRPLPTSTLTSRWRSFFGAMPQFGSARSTIRLASQSMESPLRTADAEVARRMNDTASSDPDALRLRLQQLVRTKLSSEFDCEMVAAEVGLTSRTLQRRLSEQQITLRELVAATRIEVASELLRDSRSSITEISQAIGFAQPASFTRAFVAAIGVTPGEFRKRERV